MATWMSEVLKRVESGAAVPLPAPPDPFREALQATVRSAVKGLKQRLEEVPPIPDLNPLIQAEPAEAAATGPEERLVLESVLKVDAPAPELKALVQEELSKPALPAPPEEELPSPEERQALEEVLGVGAPPPPPPVPRKETEAAPDLEALVQAELSRSGSQPAAPSPAVPAPKVVPAASPPQPLPAPSHPVPVLPRALLPVMRVLNFCWTGLLRLLSILDRLAPAPIRARKALLGRIGVAAAATATLGLAGLAFLRMRGR